MGDGLGFLGFGEGGWGWALAGGTWITVQAAVASYLVGLAIGLAGVSAKLRGPPVLRGLAEGYTTFVRGVPEILLILFVYYGGTRAIGQLAGIVAPGVVVEIDAFAAAVASLGLIAGAYATEIFRGAILAVPDGQREAATTLGLSRAVTFFKVVLPQAMRIALPALGNLWLVILKDSALVSVVGLRDLLGVAASGAAFTRKPFTFYLVVALVFLALSAASMAALHLMERRQARGYRSG